MANQTHVYTFVSALLLASITTASASDETRQLDSHEHGHAALNVAVDGKSLVIEFESPAANIVGFEHEPENSEQEAAIEKAEETMSDADSMFALPAGAGCKLVEVDVEAPYDEHHDEKHADEKHDDEKHADEKHDDHEKHDDEKHADEKHDDHDKHEGEGDVHSEFHATWLFECDNVDKLDSLQVKIFERFPGTEEIDASIIGRSGQSAAELTASSALIKL